MLHTFWQSIKLICQVLLVYLPRFFEIGRKVMLLSISLVYKFKLCADYKFYLFLWRK